MARLDLESQMPAIGDWASTWLWQAWLADSPEAARLALLKAKKRDPKNKVISAGIRFVEGLINWKPTGIETDFDIDPELLIHSDAESLDKPVEAKAEPATGTEIDAVAESDDESEATTEKSGYVDAKRTTPIGTDHLVLVVDDSPTVRKLVSLTLTRAGFEVMVAADGSEALSIIARRTPTVVLADSDMPKLDGYKLCQLIKQDKVTSQIPVVLLSEDNRVIGKLRRSMAGFSDCLVKPFRSEGLIEKVRQQTQASSDAEQSVDA